MYCLIFCYHSVNAQQKRCYADQHYANQIIESPGFEKNRLIKEAEILHFLNDSNRRNASKTEVSIPIVFHILHDGDMIGQGENISVATILATLEQLNDDYSRMNSDAGNTPGAFAGLAANTTIQFCLAFEDENGNPTSGINRVNINSLSNVSPSDCWDPDYLSNNVVSPLIWDRNNYLNIFTVQRIDYFEDGECLNNSLLGYAQFPGGPANTDAAVHAYYTMGSLSKPNADGGVYGFGRTVTHEVGHWLGLDHPWGPGFEGCNMDDAIADTPNSFEPVYGCPVFPVTDVCTPRGDGIMYMNYMDYVDDECMNMFSQGQSDRMMASINTFRSSLLNGGCNATDCPQTLTTTSGVLTSGVYDASKEIISNGKVSLSQNVRLTAKECVSLSTGFEVVNGGILTIDLVGCD